MCALPGLRKVEKAAGLSSVRYPSQVRADLTGRVEVLSSGQEGQVLLLLSRQEIEGQPLHTACLLRASPGVLAAASAQSQAQAQRLSCVTAATILPVGSQLASTSNCAAQDRGTLSTPPGSLPAAEQLLSELPKRWSECLPAASWAAQRLHGQPGTPPPDPPGRGVGQAAWHPGLPCWLHPPARQPVIMNPSQI